MTLRPRSARARGFTLIELLVVVAIIALIIALILPALGRAKEQSRRTVCAANLKGIGIAINVYAEENNNRIPPFYRGIKDNQWYQFGWGPFTTAPYYQPWTTFIGAFPPNAWTGTNNIGLLYELQLITNPHNFYCPSATWHEWQYPNPDGWKVIPLPAGTATVMMSYMYNPYPDSPTSPQFPKYHTRPEYQQTTKAIAVDMIENWRQIEDISHKPTGGGWNLLFIDSHVDFRTSKASFDKVRTGDPNSWTDMAAIIDPLNNQ